MSVTGIGAAISAPQTASGAMTERGADGGFIEPGKPNIVDFLNWLSGSVQIPDAALPAGSPWPQYALAQAVGLVIPIGAAPRVMYTLAVYNCATHILIASAPDQPGQNWFATQRSANKLLVPSTGLVVATSDEGSSTTLTAMTWASGLTPAQLGFFKTPWGREYLSWNRSYGPNIVGLT